VYAWEYQTTGIHSAPGVKQIVQTADGAAERTFHIDGQLHSDPDLQVRIYHIYLIPVVLKYYHSERKLWS
jgi:hypothetical protein